MKVATRLMLRSWAHPGRPEFGVRAAVSPARPRESDGLWVSPLGPLERADDSWCGREMGRWADGQRQVRRVGSRASVNIEGVADEWRTSDGENHSWRVRLSLARVARVDNLRDYLSQAVVGCWMLDG